MGESLINFCPYKDNMEYLNDLFSWATFKFYEYIISNSDFYTSKLVDEKIRANYMDVVNFLLYKIELGGFLEEDLTSRHIYDVIMSRIKRSDLFKLHDKKVDMNDENIIYSKENFEFITDCVLHNIEIKFGLGSLELWFLTVSLLNFFDKEFFKVFRLISGKEDVTYPTIDMCTKVFFFDKSGNIFKNYSDIYRGIRELCILFPSINTNEDFFDKPLVCDERLVDIITGQNNYCCDNTKLVSDEENLNPLMFREEELDVLLDFMQYDNYPLVVLQGPNGIGKRHLISHFCKKIKSDVLFFNIKEYLSESDKKIDRAIIPLKYSLRECAIKSMSLGVVGIEELDKSEIRKLLAILNGSVHKYIPRMFLLTEGEKFNYNEEEVFLMKLEDFNEIQLVEFWKLYSIKYKLSKDLVVEKLANTFVMTPGQIIKALRQASLMSGGIKKEISEKNIYKACYSQLDHELSKKATKTNWNFVWDDLKLHENEKSVLRDICNCVKYKHLVLNKWNFSKMVPYGSGLTVIFSGPPGTGKTMAAQVIANELNMEMYRIDLSQVIDKYIGETEKNIKQIFDQAKKSNSILFFDEADAIFNKRLEVSGANERFANIESSLLLQCIEEYKGIAIIATNNYMAIDPAFIRRFKYHIQFREPDKDLRYEIWKSVIPENAPISDNIDFLTIAELFDFTGAIIKNIMIAAAYLAADRGNKITLVDILKAIKRELEKNNVTLTKSKLGKFGYLFDEINS